MKLGILAKPLCAAAAVALLAGCSGGGGTTAPGGGPVAPPVAPPVTPPTYPSPPASARSVSAPALSNFTAILSEDATSVAVGGTINYTVILTNSSSVAAPMVTDTFNGVSAPKASLQIKNAALQVVYPPPVHPLDAPPAPPANGVIGIQPGQSVFKTTALATFTSAGTYQAVATFTVAATASDKPQVVTLAALPVTVR